MEVQKDKLPRGWRVSFEITPFGTVDGWSNIMHATIGGNNEKYGDRIPAIWFHHKSTRLRICSAVNGNKNYCFSSDPLRMKRASTVIVQQIQYSKDYRYQIIVNGKEESVVNTQTKEFYNVKYYASDPWYIPAKAFVRHFQIKCYDHSK